MFTSFTRFVGSLTTVRRRARFELKIEAALCLVAVLRLKMLLLQLKKSPNKADVSGQGINGGREVKCPLSAAKMDTFTAAYLSEGFISAHAE